MWLCTARRRQKHPTHQLSGGARTPQIVLVVLGRLSPKLEVVIVPGAASRPTHPNRGVGDRPEVSELAGPTAASGPGCSKGAPGGTISSAAL